MREVRVTAENYIALLREGGLSDERIRSELRVAIKTGPVFVTQEQDNPPLLILTEQENEEFTSLIPEIKKLLGEQFDWKSAGEAERARLESE